MADFSKYDTKKLLDTAQNQQVGGIFGKVSLRKYKAGERNILGDIFERPAAAIREGIRNIPATGKSPIAAYKEAAIKPTGVETFQDEILDKFWELPENIRTILDPSGGFGASAAGLTADVATDPAALLMMMAGKTPLGKGRTIAGQLGKTRVAQVTKKVATKDIFKEAGRQWTKFKRHPFTNPQRVSRAVSGKKEFARGLIKSDKEYTSNLIKQIDDTFDDNIRVMQNELQKSAEKGSLEVQPKLKQFIKDNSAAYKKVLGGIEDGLAQKGQMVSKGDVNNILRRTLQEAIETELPAGKAQVLIQNLIDTKYGTTQFSNNFSLVEILNDVKSVRATIKAQALAGKAGYTADDMIVSLLDKNWGSFIEKNVPELVKLNAKYAPIIQAKKLAYKTFKPFAGEFETKGGTSFLKRVGTGKAEAGELRFLSQIEKGSEFAPGVGEVSKPTIQAGKGLQVLEKAKVGAKQAITKKSLMKQKGVEKNLAGWLDKLSEIERKAVLSEWKRKGGMVAGGGMLLWLIKRQLAQKFMSALSGQDGGSTVATGGGQF